MIRADFRRGEQGFVSVRVGGHAGFAPDGEDIVCAGVTSAVMLTANAVTEILKENAHVDLAENEVVIALPQQPTGAASAFLQALHLHLTLLQQQYPRHITITEV